MTKVDLDLVVRSAARIERLAKIRYGSMAFEAPSFIRARLVVGMTIFPHVGGFAAE
jgi:hypothetical protein